MPITGGTTGQSRILTLFSAAQTGQITPGSSATNMPGTGLFAGTVTMQDNTADPRTVTSFGRSVAQDSTAVIGNNVGWFHSDDNFRMDEKCIMIFNVGFGHVTNVREFVGLLSTPALGTAANGCDADTLGALGFGMQLSTDRGDTSLQLVSWNGTTQTTTPSGFMPSALTFYSFEFEIVSATNVSVRVYNSTGSTLYAGSITSTLPASTTKLSPIFCAEPRTGSLVTLYTYSASGIGLGYIR